MGAAAVGVGSLVGLTLAVGICVGKMGVDGFVGVLQAARKKTTNEITNTCENNFLQLKMSLLLLMLEMRKWLGDRVLLSLQSAMRRDIQARINEI